MEVKEKTMSQIRNELNRYEAVIVEAVQRTIAAGVPEGSILIEGGFNVGLQGKSGRASYTVRVFQGYGGCEE